MVYSIQYLRFFAALAVLIVHICDEIGLSFHQGHFGVDLFFVISGFVIYFVTDHEQQRLGTFLRKRALRVAVPYYVILGFVVCDVLFLGLLDYAFRDLTLSNILHSFAFVFETGETGAFNLPIYRIGWTLNYEMFFYLIFGICMAVSHRHRFLLSSAVIMGLSVFQWWVKFEGGFWYMLQTRTSIEFIYGMAIAFAYTRFSNLPRRFRRLSVAGLVLSCFALALMWLAPSVSAYSGTRFLTAGLPASLLVLGLLMLEHTGRLPFWGPLFYLGGASYSLYLVHLLVVKGMTVALPGPFISEAPLMALGLMMGASLLAAIAFHHLCERPVMRYSKSISQSRVPMSS